MVYPSMFEAVVSVAHVNLLLPHIFQVFFCFRELCFFVLAHVRSFFVDVFEPVGSILEV